MTYRIFNKNAIFFHQPSRLRLLICSKHQFFGYFLNHRSLFDYWNESLNFRYLKRSARGLVKERLAFFFLRRKWLERRNSRKMIFSEAFWLIRWKTGIINQRKKLNLKTKQTIFSKWENSSILPKKQSCNFIIGMKKSKKLNKFNFCKKKSTFKNICI